LIVACTEDHQVIGILLENMKGAAVGFWLRRIVFLPLIRLAVCSIRKHALMIGIRYDNGAVDATFWCPNDIWTAAGLYTVDNNGISIGISKVKRTVGKPVVNGVSGTRP
jgi:hypothetical protein